MKAKYCVFFLTLIFILSFSSAIEFKIKDEVLRGENLVVQVIGEFRTPLTKDNIYFQKRHLSTSIEPYGVEKINGDYYIYAQVPFEKEVDNYSVVLTDIEYSSGIGTSTEDLFVNFTILEGYASFSLNPGIIQTSENYFIEIKSLSSSTINVNYGEYEKSIIEINESIEVKKTFLESLFGGSENETNTTYEEFFEWNNDVELKPGETKVLEFPIENFIGLKKIKFNYENENYEVLVFIDGTKYVISQIENESVNKTDVENLSEKNFTISENGTIVFNDSLNNDSLNQDYFADNCSVLNGTVCGKDATCEGETKYTKVDTCCLGECVVEEKTNTGKTIGWILIIAIVLFLTWFFKNKYRGTRPPAIDLERESKGKKE